ncbi:MULTISPECIES: phage portal protein [Gordonibacter]|uniref:Phage portal protein n=1 Tax=Gordonibacter faecis TaxID=3047475 RepID=A0ABT7DU46_9ACTN|nr:MULTISPECIES: phage portal protein [unclassified Gordonibacter]MDJ1651635.1 phage portal protein [Gordonibacter sp. KGMB12511]HIW77057.1 phage portal protein [Candidatus Gordonibacter avicola]
MIDFIPTAIRGMTQEETATLKRLLKILDTKSHRNKIRTTYYSMHNRLNDMGIAVPPQLTNTLTVVGWPAKAVDQLAARSIFDGFVSPSDASLNGLERILLENNFENMYNQATTSELIHSCSFFTVSAGADGEPQVIISAYSAENAAAEYDYRRKRIKNGLTVIERDDDANKEPCRMNLYTDKAVIEIARSGGRWAATRKRHPHGRPLMEPLIYSPSLDRPFGKSRISRAVMSITDSAVRTALRTEVSAEFFTSPQKYLMGADSTIFEDKSKWDAYLGAIFAVSKDEDGDIPQFGQLSQMSMQPHTEYMRSLAARFSGETNIPVSSLGVIHDNPSSAEAIYVAKEDLIIEAMNLNKTNGIALRNVALLVIAMLQNKPLPKLKDDERAIKAHFRNPAMPSVVSQADAMCKIASAAPWIAETEVFLEEIGFDEAQRDRLLSDKRKASAVGGYLSQLAKPVEAAPQEADVNDKQQPN